MSKGKVLLGILAGVATGALLGMLFAPEKGEKTRRKIAKKGMDVVGDARVAIDDILVGVKDKLENTKQELNHWMEKAIKEPAREEKV